MTLAQRALHLRIHPRPSSLSESREILRVLQQYGKISFYKSLRHANPIPMPNTALAIFEKEQDALSLVAASPLRFVLEPRGGGRFDSWESPEEDSRADARVENGTATSHPEVASDSPIPKTPSTAFLRPARVPASGDDPQHIIPFPLSPPPPLNPSPKTFQIRARHSGLNHGEYVERQHFHGPFRVNNSTPIYEDMHGRVPIGALAGVRVGAPEVLWRIVAKRKQEEGRRISYGGLRKLWQEGMNNPGDQVTKGEWGRTRG